MPPPPTPSDTASPAATAQLSASASEKHATHVAPPPPPPSASQPMQRPSGPVSASANPKQRSCVICRRRKVRCDKQSPCANCRNANVACTYPSSDRLPRWARRLDRLTNGGNSMADSSTDLSRASAAAAGGDEQRASDPQAVVVLERLRNLEGLVRELSGQLEQTNASSGSVDGGLRAASTANSPGSASGTSGSRDAHQGLSGVSSPSVRHAGVQNQSGRMVRKDADRSRYVSSGFWTRVDDELNGLKMDLAGGGPDSSEDESHMENTPSSQELDRTPSERHGFIFQHNLNPSASDARQFHPLPSQIPFLLNTYSENVNVFTQVVHMPTITKMMREVSRSDMSTLPPAKEALLFAMYYAAITSMEEDDVLKNFGISKGELSRRFRLGLEHALARADFLNVPDVVLVQAFIVFLALLRRHESPRFVWMMVGLVIRMAQSLGLHRDGSHFDHLSPYEVEMRRRAWWSICMLDVRASEDQGTEYTIPMRSFDTKIPLNINDADIGPEIKSAPTESQGRTDMSFAVDVFKICDITRQIMSPGDKERAPGLSEQVRLVDELYTTIEHGILRHSADNDSIANWVGITAVRLTMSKMLLMIYLPTLASSPSPNDDNDSENETSRPDSLRDKLLVAAVEVAEYNHALNAEESCRQWRWMYQTYTHWHAVVLLLIEITRRPLSPLVERAWVALHSRWLIPSQRPGKLQVWIPLRRLMAKAGAHRDAEMSRLRGDAAAVEQLERADGEIPGPASPSLFRSDEDLRRHWHSLVDGSGRQNIQAHYSHAAGTKGDAGSFLAARQAHAVQGQLLCPGMSMETSSLSYAPTQSGEQYAATMADRGGASEQARGSAFPYFSATSSKAHQLQVNSLQWLWADMDPASDGMADVDVNMDVDNEADWLGWLESAKNIEMAQDGNL